MMFLRHRLSIRAQLLLLVLSVVLPAAGIFVYYVADESQEASEAAYAKVKILADNTVASLDLILRDHEAVISQLAERPLVRALDARNFDPLVGEFTRLHPEFNNFGVHDLDANNIYSNQPNPSSPQAAREFPWFQEGIRSGKFTAGNAFLGRLSGRWVSVLTFPVRDDEGKVSGLLNLSLDLLKLNERVFQHSPKNAVQWVLDREDKFLLRSIDPAAWIGKPLPGPHADAIRARSADFFSMRGVDGVQRLHAVAAVPGTEWRVFASLPEDEVFADYRERLVRAAVVGLAVLLLVLTLAWRMGVAVATPIRELASTAARITDGDTAARACVAGPTEIDYVAQEFNRMLDVLERQREERAALVGHIEKLFRLARDVILLIDPSGNVVEANDAAVAAYGYGLDELRGMNIRDLRTVEAQAAIDRDWQGASGPLGVLFETVNRRKDGSTFPVEVSAQTIDIEGKPYRQSFIRDITERKRAEQALHESEARFRSLTEMSSDFYWESDAEHRLTQRASADKSLSSVSVFQQGAQIGQRRWEIPYLSPDEAGWQAHRAVLDAHRPFRDFDLSRLGADGTERYISISGDPVFDESGTFRGYRGVGTDITARKRAEGALQQEHARLLESERELLNAHESLAEADRLESVGRLAAGVAHEVKNPLTIIRLGTDYLAKQFPQESNQEVLDDIRTAIDRAEHVITDLLDFSRQNPFAPRPTNINEVIDNAINLIKHEIDRRNIVIIRNRDDPMPPIYADPDRLVQVFINLLSNAAQAVGGDGRIEIVTRSICLSERDLEQAGTSTLRIGEPVVTVDIRDNGPGIPAEHEEKLFEPFFTTKPVGEGSGLGLAVSRSIVIMHRGSISISNRSEGGASALLMFRVYREHLTDEKANTGSR